MVNKIIFAQSTLELLPDVNNFVSLFPYALSKNTKTILRSLCTKIHQSVKHSPICIQENIHDTKAFISNIRESHFLYNKIPDIIREKIESSDTRGCIYTFSLHGKNITIHLVLPKPSIHNTEYSRIYHSEELLHLFFESCISKITAWLGIALPLSNKTCAKTLSCYLFFTDHKKILPKNNKMKMHNEEPIDNHIEPIHANTAFTTSCTPSSTIMLYRMEEWFKVFIHETFHSLGLDFSEMNTVSSNKQIIHLFPGCSDMLDVRLYETYCEVWAELLNALFIAYFLETQKRISSRVFTKSQTKHSIRKTQRYRVNLYSRNISRIITKTEQFIQYERAFTMYQAVKVLAYYNLTYTDLCEETISNIQYNENTSVFAYYILKSILVYHINEFIEWCHIHNGNSSMLSFAKTNQNILEYGELIERLYKKEDFIKNMDTLMQYYKTNTPVKSKSIHTTLRMSLYEI